MYYGLKKASSYLYVDNVSNDGAVEDELGARHSDMDIHKIGGHVRGIEVGPNQLRLGRPMSLRALRAQST